MPELSIIEAKVPARAERRLEVVKSENRLAPVQNMLKGPIFSRARDIIAANMNDLLDRAEDPARMIRMVIIEMEETLVEVRATAARSIADVKELRSQRSRLQRLQGDWAEKAELALSKDREDLARAALVEKGRIVQLCEQVDSELGEIESLLAGYEDNIRALQSKLAEARQRQSQIANRMELAASRVRTHTLVHGSRTEEAFSRFDLLERRADQAEAEAEALGLGLEDEIETLRSSDAVDAELAAMKARLAGNKE